MPRSHPTEADLMAELSAVSRPKLPVGVGWYTLRELSEKSGRHVTTLQSRMNRLVARGEVEVFEGRAFDPRGGLRSIRFFRAKPGMKL